MKLKKREKYYDNGKLKCLYFNDKNNLYNGYDEFNFNNGTKDKVYWVNGEKVGFEIYGDKKFYNI